MNTLINFHAPKIKLKKKFHKKTWIIRGIENSIQKKYTLFKKHINCNNQDNKKT